MNGGEKDEILDALQYSRRSFLISLSGVTEELAVKSTGADRWSILECVEHVAVSEEFLLSLIPQAKTGESPVVDESRAAFILAHGADRSHPVISPEAVRPAARFTTLDDAVQCWSRSRDRTFQFVEGCNENLHSKWVTHPLLGPVNCYEVLALIAVHPDRHAKQIFEIRACFF